MNIKKLLGILFCVVCILSAAPAWAQDADIEAATKVVDDFYNLQKQGRHEAVLELMTDPIRSKTAAEWEQFAPIREYILTVMQKSTHKIVAAEMVDNVIHVTIEVTMPDTQTMAAKVEKGIPANLPQDEYLHAWNDNAVKILQTEKLPTMANKITMVLVKENGSWKIAREQQEPL